MHYAKAQPMLHKTYKNELSKEFEKKQYLIYKLDHVYTC